MYTNYLLCLQLFVMLRSVAVQLVISAVAVQQKQNAPTDPTDGSQHPKENKENLWRYTARKYKYYCYLFTFKLDCKNGTMST